MHAFKQMALLLTELPASCSITTGSQMYITYVHKFKLTRNTFQVQSKKPHTLPGVLLAVEIYLEVGGIEVDDWRVWLAHEPLPGGGQELLAAGREHAHQLFQRLELITSVTI